MSDSSSTVRLSLLRPCPTAIDATDVVGRTRGDGDHEEGVAGRGLGAVRRASATVAGPAGGHVDDEAHVAAGRPPCRDTGGSTVGSPADSTKLVPKGR